MRGPASRVVPTRQEFAFWITQTYRFRNVDANTLGRTIGLSRPQTGGLLVSSTDDYAVVFHRRITTAFIAFGVAVGAGLLWLANGQPGVALRDGDYGCRSDDSALGRPGPGVTVENGKVVDVWDFNLRTGEKASLDWSNAKRESPKKVTVTSHDPISRDQSRSWVCELD
jgi:hypothetical protein